MIFQLEGHLCSWIFKTKMFFNMDYILSFRCSPALPCYAVNLVHLTFLLLRIISSHDLKNKRLLLGYSGYKQFTELDIEEFLLLQGITFGY